jgi:hypothetical protein
MKLVEGTYQAAMQVKVLSPGKSNIIEVDVFAQTEDNMKDDDMVSYYSLYRGLSPWHDMKWNLRELGRSSVFSREYVGTSQSRQGLTNDTEEVGLIDSTRSIGKLCTWGSSQQYDSWSSANQRNTLRL